MVRDKWDPKHVNQVEKILDVIRVKLSDEMHDFDTKACHFVLCETRFIVWNKFAHGLGGPN